MKLFCLPYAGASAFSIYTKYKKYNWSKGIEVVPIELPGKGIRMDEKPCSNMNELISDVVELLNCNNDKYAILGHSMGGLLAYEVAYYIEQSNLLKPSHLFISGYNPPFILDKNISKYKMGDIVFLNYLKEMGGITDEVKEMTEFAEKFLPIIKNDFRILDGYRYSSKQIIDMPTTVLYSDSDNKHNTIRKWSKLLSNVNFYRIQGDHYYINSNYLQVAGIIDTILNTYG